ncbi:hypothetical protein CMALT394_230045 [Carnobacterium maltaromaticum]|nr:hypothetical protein CMALT394_230045 [Carnobacterium maltaromaticum]
MPTFLYLIKSVIVNYTNEIAEIQEKLQLRGLLNVKKHK